MKQPLDTLLRQPGVWRGGALSGAGHGCLSTGFAVLDEALPGGGWSLGSITEVLFAREGIGELRLVMPALARMSRRDRWIVWVAPPYIPHAPALSRGGVELSRVLWVRAASNPDKLWAAEQALGSKACGAVLLWLPAADDRTLRRLQIAAHKGGTWGVLFRPGRARDCASPAALRLQLNASTAGTRVRVLKCRGGKTGDRFISFPAEAF